MAGVYLTCLFFVVRRPRAIIAASPASALIRFLQYIGEEILIVLGTSSSESALPRLMREARAPRLLRSRSSGSSCPTGYSFNLDGTAIYMTMARAVRRAGERRASCRCGQQLGVLGVLLVTSKGAAAVTGSGFMTLAATLAGIPERFRSPG